MSQTYDVIHFINKFTAIPEERWCEDSYSDGDKHCALGHCGEYPGAICDEAQALHDLFRDNLNTLPSYVNDCGDERYPQPTPRARILAALNDIAAMQAVPVDTLMAECLANIETKGGPY